MNCVKFLLYPLLYTAMVNTLHAGPITYAQAGTVAAETQTYAETSGGLDMFYVGSTAGYTDYVGVYDLQTGYNSGLLFDNRTTSVGASAIVGAGAGQINAGDQLVFYIDSPEGIFSSLAEDSPDGINHAYVASFVSGTMNGVQIPSGLFLGMEDESLGESDLNYNDEDFVVTNVTASVTPEPSPLLLLGTGLIGLIVLMIRRRTSKNML